MTQEKLTGSNRLVMPGMMIPSYRGSLAHERGVEKKILMRVWGGIGDQICAEPTIRYAIKNFKDSEIHLAAEYPELFRHLEFKGVYDLNKEQPKWDEFFVFNTLYPTTHLQWEFMSHMLVHCVDYASLCAFRMQLPILDRAVILSPSKPTSEKILNVANGFEANGILIHPGKHWPSKTFPKDWWDSVITRIIALGGQPILIGARSDYNRGTVDVNIDGCIDLRDQTSINDCAWLTQAMKVLITNDSSPLHMAAAGDAWIGFLASCKHPEYITHYRDTGGRVEFGYKMQNLSVGGAWVGADYCPNKVDGITIENATDEQVRSWLPEPMTVSKWAIERLEIHA